MTYDDRHGGPFDRGGADYWYGRPFEPHYFVGATYSSDKVELADMSPEEVAAYSAGYKQAEDHGEQKDWGHD